MLWLEKLLGIWPRYVTQNIYSSTECHGQHPDTAQMCSSSRMGNCHVVTRYSTIQQGYEMKSTASDNVDEAYKQKYELSGVKESS